MDQPSYDSDQAQEAIGDFYGALNSNLTEQVGQSFRQLSESCDKYLNFKEVELETRPVIAEKCADAPDDETRSRIVSSNLRQVMDRIQNAQRDVDEDLLAKLRRVTKLAQDESPAKSHINMVDTIGRLSAGQNTAADFAFPTFSPTATGLTEAEVRYLFDGVAWMASKIHDDQQKEFVYMWVYQMKLRQPQTPKEQVEIQLIELWDSDKAPSAVLKEELAAFLQYAPDGAGDLVRTWIHLLRALQASTAKYSSEMVSDLFKFIGWMRSKMGLGERTQTLYKFITEMLMLQPGSTQDRVYAKIQHIKFDHPEPENAFRKEFESFAHNEDDTVFLGSIRQWLAELKELLATSLDEEQQHWETAWDQMNGMLADVEHLGLLDKLLVNSSTAKRSPTRHEKALQDRAEATLLEYERVRDHLGGPEELSRVFRERLEVAIDNSKYPAKHKHPVGEVLPELQRFRQAWEKKLEKHGYKAINWRPVRVLEMARVRSKKGIIPFIWQGASPKKGDPGYARYTLNRLNKKIYDSVYEFREHRDQPVKPQEDLDKDEYLESAIEWEALSAKGSELSVLANDMLDYDATRQFYIDSQQRLLKYNLEQVDDMVQTYRDKLKLERIYKDSESAKLKDF